MGDHFVRIFILYTLFPVVIFTSFFIFPYFSIKMVNDDICCHNFSSFLPRIICVAVMVRGICDCYFSDTKLHGSQRNYCCIKVRKSTVFHLNFSRTILRGFYRLFHQSSNFWTSFMISVQSPCLCSRCWGGKSDSWSPIAGLLHLFPPLCYHLFPFLSFDWSLSFCFILLDTENRF